MLTFPHILGDALSGALKLAKLFTCGDELGYQIVPVTDG